MADASTLPSPAPRSTRRFPRRPINWNMRNRLVTFRHPLKPKPVAPSHPSEALLKWEYTRWIIFFGCNPEKNHSNHWNQASDEIKHQNIRMARWDHQEHRARNVYRPFWWNQIFEGVVSTQGSVETHFELVFWMPQIQVDSLNLLIPAMRGNSMRAPRCFWF